MHLYPRRRNVAAHVAEELKIGYIRCPFYGLGGTQKEKKGFRYTNLILDVYLFSTMEITLPGIIGVSCIFHIASFQTPPLTLSTSSCFVLLKSR